VGAFLGFLLGVFLNLQGRGGAALVLLTTFIGWVVSLTLPLLILRGAGNVGSTLYSPSGRSTPRKKEYSLAESLAVRGRYDEAVNAYEAATREDPSDPTPYLRAARIQRDRLGDCDQAARWFKRALEQSEMHSGLVMLTRKELVELYEVQMAQPGRAAPLLARIAEESAGTPGGDWAASELRRIKQILERKSRGS